MLSAFGRGRAGVVLCLNLDVRHSPRAVTVYGGQSSAHQTPLNAVCAQSPTKPTAPSAASAHPSSPAP